MTYLFFRAMMIFMSVMGLITMMTLDDYKYVLFPIAMFVWSIFSFFDEDDKEYMRRNNINPNSHSWFFPEDEGYYNYEYYDSGQRQYHSNTRTTHVTRVTTPDPEYKKIVKRCRKNFKVTIDKINKDEK